MNQEFSVQEFPLKPHTCPCDPFRPDPDCSQANPSEWCVVDMLVAAVPGQPTLNYFCFSFWLQLPSGTEPMHCFPHCSYLSLGCQQVVAVRIDFGSCSPWCWSRCFPFSEGIFSFMYVNLNVQAVCHKSQCTSFHLPQRPTHGCVSRRSNVWWLLLHCLRLHFQDLGLPQEIDGNSFPSRSCRTFKNLTEVPENVFVESSGSNACKSCLEQPRVNKCSIDKCDSDVYPKGFGGWQSWERERLFTLVGPSENFLILITVTLFCACQPARKFESQPDPLVCLI